MNVKYGGDTLELILQPESVKERQFALFVLQCLNGGGELLATLDDGRYMKMRFGGKKETGARP